MRVFPGLAIFFILAAFFLPSSTHAAVLSKPANTLGLVGYWPFNEGAGTIAGDYSGQKNNGTFSGSTLPSWTAGKRGGALSFDGSTSYIPVLRNVSDDFTISAWIKTTQNTAGCGGQWYCGQGIVDGEVGGVTNDFGMAVYNGKLAFGVGNSDTTVLSNANVNTGTWVLVTATRVKSTGAMKVYVNGVLDNTGTGGTQSLTAPSTLYIGKDVNNNPSASFLGGSIDDVRIYNRVLSAAEVAGLYSSGAAQVRAPNNLGLVGSWNFDEGTGTLAGDTSGNKNNGAFVSSPVWVSGRHGTALRFDGIDDGVNVGTIVPTTAATYSGWIYINGANSNYGAIFTNWGAGGNAFFIGTQIANPSDIEVYFNGPKIFDITNVPLNTWVYLTVTHTGTTATAYINGVQTNSGAASLITASGVTSMGYDVNRANYAFKGSLDDMRIYNRVLSAAEIAGLYSQGATQINTSSASLSTDSSLATGLVGLWTFDGPDLTDKIYDRSGLGNNAYAYNDATSSSKRIGKLGQGFGFDGADDFVRVANICNTDFSSYGAGTISLWFKADTISYTGDTDSWSDVLFSGRYDEFTLAFEADHHLHFEVYNSSYHSLESVSTSFAAQQWYHVVTEYGSGGQKIYINGVLDNSNSDTTLPRVFCGDIDKLIIGGVYIPAGWGTRGFNGTIDDVRVYNRALSAAEVKQLYLLGQ